MNRIRLLLFICFCLYAGINNRIIDTQYSQGHKYCEKSKDPSLFEQFNGAVDSLANIAFSIGNIIDNFNSNNQYNSYSEYVNAQRRKENEFNQIFPTANLKRIAQQLNVNCFLYDKKIDMIDDGTIIETPYNIRPLN